MNYYPGRNGFQGGYNNNNSRGFGNNNQPNNQRQYKDMQGKAWRNMRATKPNSPAFTGQVQIAGVTYYVSIWLGSHPQRGDEISMKFNAKNEQRREQFQNGPSYNGFQPQQPPAPNNTYSFAPANQHQPYNSGPQFTGHPQPQQPFPQHQPPQQPSNNAVPPPANSPADYGMQGYPDEDEADFPGF